MIDSATKAMMERFWSFRHHRQLTRGKVGAAVVVGNNGELSESLADDLLQFMRNNGMNPLGRVTAAGANPCLGCPDSLSSCEFSGVVANYGMQLLVANALQGNPRYLETALENLHYLLGRNTFSLSFVTQLGANPFRHPHHRPSAADGKPEPWPGLLSGGPNRARQDALLRRLPADLPPAKMYVDSEGSYASNEVAINWNAALVFVLAGVLPEK